MGCNCGGGAKTGAGPGPTGLTQYRLKYPDGRVQVYLHEGQATREAEKTGAEMEIIHL